MAFIKKTWKNRTSQYPNRRQLTDESGNVSLVTVVRSEGTVSEEGDAFDEDNMNNLEDRIEDAVGKFLTVQTLETGETNLTFTDDSIDENSVITPYTSLFGVTPTGITATTGQIVLTFDSQSSDVEVTIKIENVEE